jgi:hypothetical protein
MIKKLIGGTKNRKSSARMALKAPKTAIGVKYRPTSLLSDLQSQDKSVIKLRRGER